MSKDILWNPEMISYDDFKHILKVWNNTDEELEKLASTYPKLCFYTSTLCKDIVNLNNLEIIYLDDLKLSTDLWLEFIKNNQKIKEVKLRYNTVSANMNIKVVEHLLSIPTLENVSLCNVNALYLPPGPSNITELTIEGDIKHKEEIPIMMESWTKNLRTYTKLKILRIKACDILLASLEPFIDLGLTCPQLDKIEISSSQNKTAFEPLAKVLLTIPSLKFLTINGDITCTLSGEERLKMVNDMMEEINNYRRPITENPLFTGQPPPWLTLCNLRNTNDSFPEPKN